MRCPDCGSDRIIILVHSLRALCAECLSQWSPEISVGMEKLDGAAELAEVLYMDTPPVDPPAEAEAGELD
jgi:hypothetical protein